MAPMDYIKILKRRKWSLMLPALIVFAIAVGVALALPSIYMSTSTILIEEQDIPADFVMATVTSYVEQRLQSINQRIMSFTKLSEIIQRLNLYPELRDKLTAEEIVEKMKEDTVLEPVSTEVVDRRTGRPTAATIAFTLSYQGEKSQYRPAGRQCPDLFVFIGKPPGPRNSGQRNLGFSRIRDGKDQSKAGRS